MTKKLFLYLNTIIYLKSEQIFYRLFYLFRGKYRRFTGFKYNFYSEKKSPGLKLEDSIRPHTSLKDDAFTFLNLSKRFTTDIDWNLGDYGKLWAYHLNYFDYLHQKDIAVKDGLRLINDFINNIEKNKVGLEAFPISIRCVNWVKFITRHEIVDKNIDASLYSQYDILSDNLEYHLLGNHLLENAFSLLYGAYYFNDFSLYEKAKKLLLKELSEQILPDGGHFELSPMYHQMILFRVLDSINLVKNNNLFNRELLDPFKKNAIRMLKWLNAITFENGCIPLFNDSSNKIAPNTMELNEYATRIGLEGFTSPEGYCLKESGYRKIKKKDYEMVIDIGNIGPDYIPGHAHSDTFGFELHIGCRPFIVDTGASTYEPDELRQHQRSTRAHNTVQIGNLDQSEVWGGFRVAKRAYVEGIKEEHGRISAMHTGYKRLGALHQRDFELYEDQIIIKDILISNNMHTCYSYLHFYPDIEVKLDGNTVMANDKKIIIDNSENIEIADYDYAPEFNRLIRSKVIISRFENSLITKVMI